METAHRQGVAAMLVWCAAAAFALVHILSLPPSLEDLDSVNFAMGVRELDVARHQPHPPGYPAFIALGRVATAAFRAAGATSPEVAGLAIWSALGGALAIVFAFGFFRYTSGDDRHAAFAAILLASSPLFWFTALRPLSDVAGLATALAALTATTAAVRLPHPWTSRATVWLGLGAVLAGLSIGFRSQMALFVGPLLGAVSLGWPVRVPGRARMTVLALFATGVLAWAVPLVVDAGGPAAYLRAIGSQAGEDFAGVVMLWTHPGLRVAAFAVLHTFARPWDSFLLAGVVLALAAVGALLLLFRAPRSLTIPILVFGPYAAFHLLFQETVTVRYALPLVPAIAYLAAAVLAEAGILAGAALGAAVAGAGLALAVPAGAAFGRTPAPVFGLLAEMSLVGQRGAEPLIGMHRRVASESRRARQWAAPVPGRLLQTPRDYEWLELTRAWREGYDGEAWFVADPQRTDLALIDAEYRRTREYRWPFDAATYVGGARPGELDWHVYERPGWFLERGWALTPEVAGVAERDGWGPHRRPSVGWIRRRSESLVMMLGGRHLGGPANPPVRIVASIDDRPVASYQVRPGFFLRFEELPASALAGEGPYARLAVRAEAAAIGAAPPVSIEQFNVQAPDVVQFGFDDGWYEPEYNAQTARSWRWTGEAAALAVRPAHTVVIRIRGESPLRYFDEAPRVWLTVGPQTLAEQRPDEDFTMEVTVPGDALAAAGGRVVIHSDRVYVPGEREGTADRRRLALRIYSVDVRAAGPVGLAPINR